MNNPNYEFLIPAVKDFPDEPLKKQKSSTKARIHKEEEEENEEEDEDE